MSEFSEEFLNSFFNTPSKDDPAEELVEKWASTDKSPRSAEINAKKEELEKVLNEMSIDDIYALAKNVEALAGSEEKVADAADFSEEEKAELAEILHSISAKELLDIISEVESEEKVAEDEDDLDLDNMSAKELLELLEEIEDDEE